MRRAYEVDAGGEAIGSEVTALEYDTEHDPRRFSVLPPAGAREVAAAGAGSCAGSAGPVGAGSFPPQPGFLHPAYAPGGYRSLAAGTEAGAGGGCAPVAVWAVLEGPGGARLVLRQRLRPGGLPRSVGSWHTVDAGLDDAHGDARGGVRRLVWRDGDVVALLEAEALPLAELIRIARSARPAPGSPRGRRGRACPGAEASGPGDHAPSPPQTGMMERERRSSSARSLPRPSSSVASRPPR